MVASAQGRDVSNYNGHYDWAGTSGLSFGFFRLTEGLGSAYNSPDPDAAWNHAEIAKKGLIRGAYHFGHPAAGSGPAQATYFVDAMTKLGLTARDVLILDHETNDGLPPSVVASHGVAFMKELEVLAPHNPNLVYTYIDFEVQGNCAGMNAWPLYLAHPASIAPTPAEDRPWTRWYFWQYGIRGTDLDAFNGTEAELQAWIDSYATKEKLVRTVSDGTLSAAGAATNLHTTVKRIAELTVTHANPYHARMFVDYLLGPGPMAFMRPGLVYYTESA
jgi:lysozyme